MQPCDAQIDMPCKLPCNMQCKLQHDRPCIMQCNMPWSSAICYASHTILVLMHAEESQSRCRPKVKRHSASHTAAQLTWKVWFARTTNCQVRQSLLMQSVCLLSLLCIAAPSTHSCSLSSPSIHDFNVAIHLLCIRWAFLSLACVCMRSHSCGWAFMHACMA